MTEKDMNGNFVYVSSVRGSVVDVRFPKMVPVGEELMGRVFNVFGTPIDHKGIVKAVERRSIHQPPVSISRQITTSQIYEIGIKAIDVLQGKAS
jgi:F-type H+-transporting ATPase subunit beta